MKKKILLTSILTIALCMSLIAGATFSLFTSESSVNIAVNSGKVKVEATISESSLKLYSMNEYQGDGVTTFENGGTAAVGTDGALTLSLISPGDKAEFDITIENTSNIAIKYRVVAKFAMGDMELYQQLEFGIEEGYTLGKWVDLGAEAVIDPITVSVELPESAGNEFQDLSADVVFTVEAVQGNAEVTDAEEGTIYIQAADDAKQNGKTLQSTIMNAKDGDTIYVSSGTYDILRENNISVSGQSGWYLPITANNVTIIGSEGAELTSSEVSANGSWASQNMITIFGDGVTLEGFVIKPKMDSNKAIEILGKNSTLRNISIECNDIITHQEYLDGKGIEANSETDYWEFYRTAFAGSIYYNSADDDIGNSVLENVTVNKAWISTSDVNTGSITATDVVLDFAGCGYAEGSLPISANAASIFTGGSGLTVRVDNTLGNMQGLLDRLPAGATVELAAGEYDMTENQAFAGNYGLIINNSITLKGAGSDTIIKIGGNNTAISGQAYFYVNADSVTVSDMTIESLQTGTTTSERYDLVKVSATGSNSGTIENTAFRNVTFIGDTNNYLNLHGTSNVVIESCILGTGDDTALKCALSVAESSNVTISETAIAAGAWGSVGLMDSIGYASGSSVTFNNCDIESAVYVEIVGGHTSTVSGLNAPEWTSATIDDKLIYTKNV